MEVVNINAVLITGIGEVKISQDGKTITVDIQAAESRLKGFAIRPATAETLIRALKHACAAARRASKSHPGKSPMN